MRDDAVNKDFDKLAKAWEMLGKEAPLEAIATPVFDEKPWEDKDFFKSGVTEISGVMSLLASRHRCLNTKKALDFGCGVGRLTFALCDYFDEVVGVDVSSAMVDMANMYNKKFNRKSIFKVNKEQNLKVFEDGTFSFIYTNMTLQHMKPIFIFEYVREFLRILDKTGVLVFQLPRLVEIAPKKPKGLTQMMKGLIPRWLLKPFRGKVAAEYSRLSWIKSKMEMHGVEENQITPLIKNHGGEIFYLRRETDAERPHWESLWYFVKKA